MKEDSQGLPLPRTVKATLVTELQGTHTQHLVDLLAWRKACTINGDMFFAPFNGKCWTCGGDLVKHYLETGKAESTGCPLCNRSYVE